MYAVVFSLLTQRSSVHSPECRRVKAARNPGQPFEVCMVHASTPSDAAKIISSKSQLSERGLPEPTICKCAK